MIAEVVMPQMGADMEEGKIVRWLKREGDGVERGEIIAEIETDKANVEIEAFESGTFRKVLASEGDTVSVGAIIAVIGDPEDDVASYEGAPAATRPEDAQPAAAGAQRPAPIPAKVPGTGDGRVRASPVARKLAKERGVELTSLRGTGPGGRIVLRDVEAAAAGQAAGAAGPSPSDASAAPATGTSKMRQAIARRMAQSKREAPHYYVTMDIDMTESERLRAQFNHAGDGELRVSVNDLIVKASAVALSRHPGFNTWYVEGEVRAHERINICVAIALEDGLIAPAILDCEHKSLAQIARASRDLAERAKSGSLKPDEYSGGTFTVSNLGMFGVETLLAIIQPPQTAILGVGTIRPEPVVRDGQVTVAERMKVALSADHRVTDGAQGAQFLNELSRLLEHPLALLVWP